MDNEEKEKIVNYLESLLEMDSDKMVAKVNSYLDDEIVEEFVNHIEDFYGIEDDEQLGMLAQIMISGYIVAKETSS